MESKLIDKFDIIPGKINYINYISITQPTNQPVKSNNANQEFRALFLLSLLLDFVLDFRDFPINVADRLLLLLYQGTVIRLRFGEFLDVFRIRIVLLSVFETGGEFHLGVDFGFFLLQLFYRGPLLLHQVVHFETFLFLLIFHDSVFPLTAGQLLVEQNRLIDRRLSIVGHGAIHTSSIPLPVPATQPNLLEKLPLQVPM